MKQVHKSLLTMLALLVVAGAIALAAAWAGRDEEKKAEAKEKSEKLFDFDKAQVKSLRLAKGGKPTAALAKQEKGWKLTEPVQAEADDQAVSSLIDQLAALKQKKDLGEEKDAKAYGLDAPRLAVSVVLDGGKEQGLEVGTDNTFDGTIYLRKLGDPVIRVADGSVKSSFDKSLFDLRDKRVAHLDDAAEVRRVEVGGVKSPYVLEKDGTAWKLGGAAADSAAADRVVSAVKGLKATGIAAEKAEGLGQYGLDKPKVTVKLGVGAPGGKDTLARTVVFGQPGPGKGSVAVKTYARRDDSPAVFEVDNQILKDLDKEPFDLQDKQLVHLDRQVVRKVIFEGPAGKVEVARSTPALPDGGTGEEQFAVVAPQAGPAKKWKLSSALYSLASLRAAAFDGAVPKDLAKYGLDKPKTVTVFGDGEKVLARVRVGAEKDNKRYVLSEGVDKLARVEAGTISDWPWTAADALEPPPASPDGGIQAAK
jgi:hypothetical protein